MNDNQDLLDITWRDFIIWAFQQESMHQEFSEITETTRLKPPKSPIDAMIDDACGVKDHYSREFSIWATDAYWGLEFAPVKLREEINERKQERVE